MSSILEIEKGASRLRHHLKAAGTPELRLLCGLHFFDTFFGGNPDGSESYLREFFPILAGSSGKADPREFLPEEVDSLRHLHELARQKSDADDAGDLESLKQLINRLETGNALEPPGHGRDKDSICIHCLFVEYNPDLDLPPRGRLLPLEIKATPISSKADDDDVVVRNPVDEPDDRFLAQARDSLRAARQYLNKRHGLSLNRRYRLDYIFNSRGVRFTGDSLGVAFAVGAISAIAGVEVFRSIISIPADVAFSGALSAGGELAAVDAESLKLKIYRAFCTEIKYLVIPRQQVTSAWDYLAGLEKTRPGRRLELVGADTLETVADDPRLIKPEKTSIPVFVSRKIWQARRSTWLEVPALMVLAAILFVLTAPARWMPRFDDNPAYTFANLNNNSLDVYNRDSLLIWSDTLNCTFSQIMGLKPEEFGEVCDFDNDGRNEVVFLPRIDINCEDRDWLRFYSYNGVLKFRRFAPILNKYPSDTEGTLYDFAGLALAQYGDETILISTVTQELPARAHIRLWNGQGDSLGWYINWGQCGLRTTIDLDGDGKEELLFLGYNNSMGCVALIALSIDSTKGFSPFKGAEEYEAEWYLPGSQYGYILFPVSDIGKVPGELPQGYNAPGSSGVCIHENDLIKVYICESDSEIGERAIIYFLNHDLRVVRIAFTDALNVRRRQLVDERKLKPIVDWPAYRLSLMEAVACWSDSGWVTNID